MKKWLFYFIFTVLLLPFLQQCLGFIDSGKLDGAFSKYHDVQFTYPKWWDGSYQNQKTLFLNDSVGFRPALVRLTNQINCTFFRKLAGSDAYVGYDNYLFSKEYVDEYEGTSYLGENIIRDEVMKLKLVQDTLRRMGKTFLFTYAPSKPHVFPDKIPAVLRPYGGQKINNYTTFKRLSDSFNINQLDCNALFISMRHTNPNTIIAKQGFHWSLYGSLLAADTLVKYIERERKIDMPELVISKMKYSDTARSSDNDIATCTNLIFPITREKFCYPDFGFSTGDTKTKPKTVFIGDSFIWQWVYQGVLDNTTTDWEYWYYFGRVYNKKNLDNDPIPMENYDWPKALLNADCIIVVFTPMNIGRFNEKEMFIEKMYNYFYPKKNTSRLTI